MVLGAREAWLGKMHGFEDGRMGERMSQISEGRRYGYGVGSGRPIEYFTSCSVDSTKVSNM